MDVAPAAVEASYHEQLSPSPGPGHKVSLNCPARLACKLCSERSARPQQKHTGDAKLHPGCQACFKTELRGKGMHSFCCLVALPLSMLTVLLATSFILFQ